MASSDQSLDLLDSGSWIGDFHDQLVVALIRQINNDCLFRVLNVPENALAILIVGSGYNHARQVCARRANAFPQAVGNFAIGSNTGNICEWDLQAAFEGPEFIPTFDFQNQSIGLVGDCYHATIIVLGN